MLVVTRKQRQRILIGDSVVITVVRMQGDRVRLGIEAPADVRILREELVFEVPEPQAEKLAQQERSGNESEQQQQPTARISPSVMCSHALLCANS